MIQRYDVELDKIIFTTIIISMKNNASDKVYVVPKGEDPINGKMSVELPTGVTTDVLSRYVRFVANAIGGLVPEKIPQDIESLLKTYNKELKKQTPLVQLIDRLVDNARDEDMTEFAPIFHKMIAGENAEKDRKNYGRKRGHFPPEDLN